MKRYPILSGGAEDILVLKPDVLTRGEPVRQAFDAGIARRRTGCHLSRTAGAASLPEVKDQIREIGEIAGHPDRAAARNRAARCGDWRARAGLAADEALSRAAAVAARLGRGQRQFCRLAAGRNRARSMPPAISVHDFRRVPSLEAIVQPEAGFSGRLRAGDLRAVTTARLFCCIRRWSGFYPPEKRMRDSGAGRQSAAG